MKFELNMGGVDRIVRIAIGVVLVLVSFFTNLSTVWMAVLLIIALVLLVTGVVGYCPAYAPFHINTRGHKP